MNFRNYSVPLLLVSACATTEPLPRELVPLNPRIANLQRAASLPWLDEGRCIVQEASAPWEVLMERCYHVLDSRRVRFHDTQGVCPVASASAAAVPAMVAICLLAQPVAIGAVVVIGVVVVGIAIAEELKAHDRMRRARPEAESSSKPAKPKPRHAPSTEEPLAEAKPKPEGLGRDWFPPQPPSSSLGPRERRPECTPKRVPPKGGHPLHNACADNVPLNDFRGANALVNGKAFDALPLATRTVWEVKTDNFDTYTPELQEIVIRTQVPKLRLERELARACGFDFRVGVRSAAHQVALERAAPDLQGFIVLMDWC